MRRDLPLAAGVALVVLSTLPAFARVFSDTGWRSAALFAAGLSLLLAVAVRRLRLPWLVSGAVSAAGLLVTLYILLLPPGPLVPGGEQLREILALLDQGLVELRETPAPAPSLPGLLVLVTGGFWIITHVVHEVVVRWRHAGLGLIPAAVLWAAPLAVPGLTGRTWPNALPFLAAAGLLLLLSGEDDLGLPNDRWRPVPAAGLAVGGVAIVVALVAPGLLPGYDQDAWVDLGGRADPRGYQPIVDVSDRLKLPEERDVLRVLSPQRNYLRLAGLDSFDGFTWRLGTTDDGSYRPDASSLFSARDVLPPEEAATATTPIFVDVEVLALENIYVPVPYQPVQILGPNRGDMVWSTEGGFLATWDTVDGELAGQPRVGVREGFEYRVQAARPTPTFEQLSEVVYDEATLARWTALPREYPALRAQADEVFAEAGAETVVEQALALQDWFARDGGFTYDLDVPALRGDDALERFVLEDQVGYCEYFATGMAVMLREAGIPARVAVGFLPGQITEEADPAAGRELHEFTVSTRDAHAWVEVLFPDYGWVTFEPTPRDDQTQIVPTAEDIAPLENERERQARELEESLEESTEDDPTTPDRDDATTPPQMELPEEPQAGSPEAGGVEGEPSRWPLVAFLLALVSVGAVLAVSRSRHPRLGHGDARHRVLAAQRHLFAIAADHGIGRRDAETTPEVVSRWHDEGRVDGRAPRFAVLAQRAAFGGDVDDHLADEAEQLVRDLEELLRASVDRRDRALAPVRVPVATVRDVTRRAVRKARDVVRG
jgi:transglutaminase-like putative cysteine protease